VEPPGITVVATVDTICPDELAITDELTSPSPVSPTVSFPINEDGGDGDDDDEDDELITDVVVDVVGDVVVINVVLVVRRQPSGSQRHFAGHYGTHTQTVSYPV
jgi:hypothetical protein